MPSHPDRVRSATLPDGYQFGDAAAVCYFCRRDLSDAVRVTMGEREPLFVCVVCEDCAKRPYPLYEIRRRWHVGHGRPRLNARS